MAEVRISLSEPFGSLLDAVAAVSKQWTDVSRCYSGSEENVELAELLDTLTDAARDLGKGKR